MDKTKKVRLISVHTCQLQRCQWVRNRVHKENTRCWKWRGWAL